MKIDKRKKYILVLDVETAGDVEKNPLILNNGTIWFCFFQVYFLYRCSIL